jgi:hypothetical protein
MRDQPVPPGRFFSTSSGATMRSHNCAVDAPKILVDRPRIDESRAKTIQDFVQRTVCIPSIETTVHRFPRSKFVREVAPRRSRSHNPKNSIDNDSPITLWSSHLGWSRKNIFDTFPLIVRKLMSRHLIPPWIRVKMPQYRKSRESRKYHF